MSSFNLPPLRRIDDSPRPLSLLYPSPAVPSPLTQEIDAFDLSSIHVNGRREYPSTKIKLVKKALTTFMKNAQFHNPAHKIVLFQFNQDTTVHEFTMDEAGVASMSVFLHQLIPNGGTNIITVCRRMKEYYDSSPHPERLVATFMSDGHHNAKEQSLQTFLEEDRQTTVFFHSFFRHIGGIGTTQSVDPMAMNHFQGGRHGVYDLVSTEQDVLDTFTGRYFDILTACLRDATLTVWCHNDGAAIPLDETVTTYHTQDDFDRVQIDSLSESEVMAMEQSHGVYVLRSTRTIATKDATPHEFLFAVDTSGSMSETVVPEEPARQETEEYDRTKPYVCHTIRLANITPDTEIPGGGHVVATTLTATDVHTKLVHTTRLPIHTTLADDTMAMYYVVLRLAHVLSKPMRKQDLHTLYKSHLEVPFRLTTMPSNLRTMGETVWHTLKTQYRSTLTRGDLFFNQTPVPLHVLRAMSSNASAETPSCGMEHREIIQEGDQDDTLCRLCFERQKTVLVPTCRQIGACQPCFIEWINASVTPTCPFCRCDVTGWIPLDLTNGSLCRGGCGQSGQYVCEKGHMLYCKTCIQTRKTDECPLCPDPVKKVRLYVL